MKKLRLSIVICLLAFYAITLFREQVINICHFTSHLSEFIRYHELTIHHHHDHSSEHNHHHQHPLLGTLESYLTQLDHDEEENKDPVLLKKLTWEHEPGFLCLICSPIIFVIQSISYLPFKTLIQYNEVETPPPDYFSI